MRRAAGSLVLALLALAAPGDEKRNITAELAAKDPAEWIGLVPDQVAWAPDGSRFYYHAGNQKPHRPDLNAVFEVPRDGGAPRRLSEAERLALPALSALEPDPALRNYSRDRRRFVYLHQGDVFLAEAGAPTRRITNTDAEESRAHFSHDDRYVLFESGQNLFGWDAETGELRQFTRFRTGKDPERQPETDFQKFLEKQQAELFATVRDQEQEHEQRKKDLAAGSGRPMEIHWLTADQKVSDMVLSADGRWVTFLLEEKAAKAGEVVYQRPVTKSGFTEPATTRAKVGDPTASEKLGILSAAEGTVRWLDTESYKKPVRFEGPWWSPDGKQAVLKLLSHDFKDLWIARLDCESGQTTTLFHDHDEAWIPIYPPTPVRWMPDSRTLYFTSERDGYRHLYTVDLEGTVRQRTQGRFDLWMQGPHPYLSRDGRHWYFHANIEDPAEQHLYRLAVEGGEPVRLTPRGGVHLAALSPDETRVALLRSTAEAPDEVYLLQNAPGAEPQRISHSTTPEFAAIHWVAPEFVRFPDADGVLIPARLYKPREPHPLRPALLQIHGSGYIQIVRRKTDIDYLHTYQQYLIAQGYTILEMDYRGSAGYGRDFRTAIHRHMGGKDLESAIAGADYLVREQGIDRRRIGIFGRSYGGFMTLMALLTKPGTFAAGVAMAPVTDWAHYNHGYTGRILNLPQADEESFRKSSPIYFAENLRDPLLMFHGMVDSNVLYQDSVRLAQRFVELKKTGWDFVSYPVENHVWDREDTKLDCLRRITAFFDAHLKTAP
jgi:dipeptidyl aminopeptidase/acylaminoacyl peptidase